MLAEMPGKYINIEEETDTGQAKKKSRNQQTKRPKYMRGLGPQGKIG